MANTIALRKAYSTALDEVYKLASLTAVLDGPNELVREGANANEILIPKMTMNGLANYNKQTGYVPGDITLEYETKKCTYDRGRMFTVDAMDNIESAGVAFGRLAAEFLRTQVVDITLEYETKKCTYDRGRMFTVDAMDNIESAGVAFGRLAAEFLRTQVVPELDAWRLASYAGYATGKVAAAIADGKAGIAAIRTGKTAIKNAEARTETCYLFISTALKGMIDDLDTTASKKAMEDWAGVIEVPTGRFFDKVTLTASGAGGFTTTGGKAIDFLIVDKDAVIQNQKHTVSKIITPEANQDADAWKYGYRTVGIGGKAIDFLIVDKDAVIQNQKHTVSKIITPEANQDADAWKYGYRTVGIAEAKDNKKVAIYVHTAAA